MKMRLYTVLALALLVVLSGCVQSGSSVITGNVVKDVNAETDNSKPSVGLSPDGLGQVCGSYSTNFKKICECLGDLERGNDGNYYCKGTCGFDCTCFRDRRVVPCPTE